MLWGLDSDFRAVISSRKQRGTVHQGWDISALPPVVANVKRILLGTRIVQNSHTFIQVVAKSTYPPPDEGFSIEHGS